MQRKKIRINIDNIQLKDIPKMEIQKKDSISIDPTPSPISPISQQKSSSDLLKGSPSDKKK